jgi:hypothetical protein
MKTKINTVAEFVEVTDMRQNIAWSKRTINKKLKELGIKDADLVADIYVFLRV